MRLRATLGAALLGLWIVSAGPHLLAGRPDGGQAAATATTPQTESQTFWAYRPVKRPELPAVQQQAWVRTPIDRFVLARLEEKAIAPSPDADRATFIRRATLDVWGLIPTPEEVAAFVADRSPDAYDKLVDRLLASPRYGERQARRWLDLARYADSTGFEGDRTRPNMWRYRDYVIDAFNQDKPYDQFVKEQIAGDELSPHSQSALVATGFLAGYPDNYNSRDMVERKYQITTDMTDTVGAVFLAQTVGCARCHNHKFDRISQKDYYQLQSFFANTSEVTNLPAAITPQEIEYQKAQHKWEEATKEIRAKRQALLDTVRAETIKYQKERYLTDTRESLFKPEGQWTPLDRWVNHRWETVTTGTDYELDRYLRETSQFELEETGQKNEKKLAALEEYRKLGEELNKFNALKPTKGSDTITTMTELGHPDAPPTHVLFVGNHEQPLEEVQPGFPAAIANGEEPVIVPTATSSGRRTALANWIASPRNPLTARVFVNRVWGQYFGRGIVETVSNFGKAGQRPTSPELLDYLADTFVSEGWSVKKLHREILLSNVYRQASDEREDVSKVDPENKLLAVFPRQRLDAEEIRDSLLAAAGKLDDKVGGPSVFAPVPKGLNAGNLWQVSKDPHDFTRRSLYIFVRRSVAYPMLDAFNMASPQQVHSQRVVTTTPLQALTLYNSDQVFEWSQALAGRVLSEAGADESARLDRLYQIVFGRTPDAQEKATLLSFLDSHGQVIASKATDGKLSIAVPTGVKGASLQNPLREAAFVDLVHAVVNSNDFAYRF
jgi:Protein of unknown function (DUF1553)/Protein of unknown function (DUF1549)